jgi:polysaccharide export outer membrane protein
MPSFSQNFDPPPPQEFTPPPAYGFVPQREFYAPGPGVNSGYILGPGDKLHVRVFGEDDLSGEYQIDGSGLVRLPLIGTLRAAGYTAPILENTIAGALAQGYLKSPRVNVEITTYRPFYIIGAVNRPGEYPYVDNMSALNAVAFGGGFTEQARESTVYEAVPASQVTRIWPGDVVRVKTTFFWEALNIF